MRNSHATITGIFWLAVLLLLPGPAAVGSGAAVPWEDQEGYAWIAPPDGSVIVLSDRRGVPPGRIVVKNARRIFANAHLRFRRDRYASVRIAVESDGYRIDGNGATFSWPGRPLSVAGRGVACIDLHGVRDTRVTNCVIEGYHTGVRMAGARRCTVMDNRFEANRYAIHLRDSHGNRIEANVFAGQRLNDIALYRSGDNRIAANRHRDTAEDCVNILYGSHGNRLSGNRYVRNGGEVIGIKVSDDNRITGNVIVEGANSIMLVGAQGNRIEHNTFLDCFETVSLEAFSHRNTVIGNLFRGARHGLELEAGLGNVIAFNRFESIEGAGCSLMGFSRGNLLAGNRFRDCGESLRIDPAAPLLAGQGRREAIDLLAKRFSPQPAGNLFTGNRIVGRSGDEEGPREGKGENRFEGNAWLPGGSRRSGRGWTLPEGREEALRDQAADWARSYDDAFENALGRLRVDARGREVSLRVAEGGTGWALCLWDAPPGTVVTRTDGVYYRPGFRVGLRRWLARWLDRRWAEPAELCPAEVVDPGPLTLKVLLVSDDGFFPAVVRCGRGETEVR